MKIILTGIIIATFGFAYAFHGAQSQSMYGGLFYLYPNLLSGFSIGIGGIVISIIGAINRRRNK